MKKTISVNQKLILLLFFITCIFLIARVVHQPDSQVEDGRYLCVFDYDLTLSSHLCKATTDNPDFSCVQTQCFTYDWNDQCLGVNARSAIAECVRRGAYIGIASHAGVDGCWDGKVLPIVSQSQFPEFTSSPHYDNQQSDLSYPAIDNRDNWNCPTCAYHMNPDMSKSDGIRKIMAHYRMDPANAEHRARVIFWDDSPWNIKDVNNFLPEVRAINVARFGDGDAGGCGITQVDIEKGWQGTIESRPLVEPDETDLQQSR
jgi:hypothetical protein